MEKTEFNIGDTVIIKGVGKSDAIRLHITITFEDGDVLTTLETPLTDDGMFQTPWTIPDNINVGNYTIKINDDQSTDSTTILIQ